MLSLFLIKFLVAISIVVILSLIAEKVSPKVAGILSGYPTTSAITLFFFGLEQSPEFAATSARYNMLGIIATLIFVYVYYKTSLHFKKFSILLSSITALITYLLVVWLLQYIPLSTNLVIIIPLSGIMLFKILFKNIENVKIKNKIKISSKFLLIRTLFAVTIILSVTEIAKLVDQNLAGLLSSFPATIFPLVLIMHYSYGIKKAHTIIKNVPTGMMSIIIYSLTINYTYSWIGVYWGTIVAFITATIYLLIYILIKKILKKKNYKFF